MTTRAFYNNQRLRIAIVILMLIDICHVIAVGADSLKDGDPATNMCIITAKSDSLHVANCSGVKMEQFYEQFQDVRNADVIDLSYSSITGELDICRSGEFHKTSKLILSHNGVTSVESIFGHPTTEINVCVPNIRFLILNDNNISILQYKEGQRQFHLLKELFVPNNSVKTLELCKETSIPNLAVMDISRNTLTNLNTSQFSKCSSLTYLNLSRNAITYIERDAFLNLPSLEVLDLSFNSIKSFLPAVFQDLSSLTFLDISANILVTLPDALPILEWFDVSQNRISSVGESAYSSVLMPHTVFLIGKNPLKCECDNFWLKELIDTRSYLLKIVKGLDAEKFIPKCSWPVYLQGKSFDDLSSADFSCDELSKEDYHETFQDDFVKETLQMVAEEIGTKFVKLRWKQTERTKRLSVEITCRSFGQKSDDSYIMVPVSVQEYRIKHLEPGSPYFICYSVGSDSYRTDKECFEILTEKVVHEYPKEPEVYFPLKVFSKYLFEILISVIVVLLSIFVCCS